MGLSAAVCVCAGGTYVSALYSMLFVRVLASTIWKVLFSAVLTKLDVGANSAGDEGKKALQDAAKGRELLI